MCLSELLCVGIIFEQIIEYLLFCNAKREAQDKNGWTPLHYAASLGMLHIVNRLIRDPGSQRSLKDRVGMTPLHEAVRGNHIACVKALVEAGPSPPGAERNAISASGNTPLHLAAFLGHTDSVRFLLDSGADANIRNNYKQFAMDIAKTEEIRDMLMVATTIKKKCCWYCCM